MVTTHSRHHQYQHCHNNSLVIAETDQHTQQIFRSISPKTLLARKALNPLSPLPSYHLHAFSQFRNERERVFYGSTLGRNTLISSDLVHRRSPSPDGTANTSSNATTNTITKSSKGSLIGYLYEKRGITLEMNGDGSKVVKHIDQFTHLQPHGSFTLDYEETLFRHARLLTPPSSATSIRMIADIRSTPHCRGGSVHNLVHGHRHMVPFIAHSQHNMWIGCVHGVDQIKFGHKLQVCLYHVQDHQDYSGNGCAGLVSIGRPICLTIAKDRIEGWQETVVRHVYYDPHGRLQRGLQVPLRTIVSQNNNPVMMKREKHGFSWNGPMRLVFSMTEDSHDTSTRMCKSGVTAYTRYAHGHPVIANKRSSKSKSHRKNNDNNNHHESMVNGREEGQQEQQEAPSESTDEMLICPLMLLETHR